MFLKLRKCYKWKKMYMLTIGVLEGQRSRKHRTFLTFWASVQSTFFNIAHWELTFLTFLQFRVFFVQRYAWNCWNATNRIFSVLRVRFRALKKKKARNCWNVKNVNDGLTMFQNCSRNCRNVKDVNVKCFPNHWGPWGSMVHKTFKILNIFCISAILSTFFVT